MSVGTIVYLVAITIAGVFAFMSYQSARRCRYYWRCRIEQGGHERAPWRTQVYDNLMYRGASRETAFKQSKWLEWSSLVDVGVFAVLALVPLCLAFLLNGYIDRVL